MKERNIKERKKQTRRASRFNNHFVVTEYVSKAERDLLDQKILLANTPAGTEDQAGLNREFQKLRALEEEVSFQKLTNPNYAVKRLVVLDPEVDRQEAEQPPRACQALIRVLLPKKDRDSLLGDLTEEYQGIYAASGEHKARAWYFRQVVASFLPLICNAIRTLLLCVFTVLLEEVIRRIAH